MGREKICLFDIPNFNSFCGRKICHSFLKKNSLCGYFVEDFLEDEHSGGKKNGTGVRINYISFKNLYG